MCVLDIRVYVSWQLCPQQTGEPISRQFAGRYNAIVIIEGNTLPPAFQDAAAFEAELVRDIPHMPKVRWSQWLRG